MQSRKSWWLRGKASRWAFGAALLVAAHPAAAVATAIAYTNHLTGGSDWNEAAAAQGYSVETVNFNAVPEGTVQNGSVLQLAPGVNLTLTSQNQMIIKEMPVLHIGNTDGILSRGQGRWSGSDDAVLLFKGQATGHGPDRLSLSVDSAAFAAALGVDDVVIHGVLFNVWDWYTGSRFMQGYDEGGNLLVDTKLAGYNFQQQHLYSFGMLSDSQLLLANLFNIRSTPSDGFFFSGFSIAYSVGSGSGGGGGGPSVPEPSSLLLGLTGAAAIRRRLRTGSNPCFAAPVER